jgi:hypothetical protein
MEKTEIIETNLGDLIVALTDETAPFVRSKDALYKTVAFMLTRLLNDEGGGSRAWQYWQ